MNKFLLVLALSSISTLALASPTTQPQKNALPKDAQVFLQRYEMCWHFAGELNGDGSKRDHELNREMAKLRCHTIERDEQNFRKKYASNKEVMAALIAIDAPY
ncbi:hypothetical protein ACF3NA_08125 [Alkanindiges sp. WGS2144]|uniref:hypothetical protein n=1 Tax=Alkanindiges sp. WGS2144 TaxID=3366808 RepID=UPI0037510ED9